ncbi:MAG: PD-(D/E)XK nuclease family protein [SAR324 cluster bacterium]
MAKLTGLDADGWLSLAESGAAVLTASGRLQRHLHERFAQRQMAQGRDVWPTATILTWSAWLDRMGRDLMLYAEAGAAAAPAPAIVLTATQEAAVWHEIVAADAAEAGLLYPGSLAQQAQDAWHLAHAWGLELSRLGRAQALPPEAARFKAWSSVYERRCRERGWMDGARLPLRVAAALDEGRLAPPRQVVLAGFDGWSPAQERVLAALAKRGCVPLELAAPAHGGTAQRTSLPDDEAEAEAALRWARAQVEAGAGSVGIVVQDLEGRRNSLARLAAEVLAPSTAVGGPDETRLPVHLSLGPALADVPLVRSALRLLHLDGGWLPLETLESALLTPYLGGAAAEREARGQLMTMLRSRGDASLRLATVAMAARRAGCERLAGCLERAANALEAAPPRQSHAAWARHAAQFLKDLGWPGHGEGERTLSSAEYQAYERWGELLDEWCALDVVLSAEERGAALARLSRLAAETRFQPQAEPAPVQILGSLEAAGLEFDALWALGFDDEAWPRPPQPNALLPLAEQRAQGMPRSSAERELAFAESVTARLRGSAHRVVFSHAAQRASAALGASPLIAGLPAVAAATLGLWRHAGLRETIRGSAQREPRTDEPLRPLPAGSAVAHGTGVFGDMAACPFRAQALHRWNAQYAALPEPGLSPADHGDLLHAALNKVWAGLKDRDTLASLDQAALAERVERAVAEALAEFRGDRLTPALARLEAERLLRLAGGLLALERARPPFAVTSAETPIAAEVGGIAVSLRIDRIDTLADGARLLLDYKSGQVQPIHKQWLSDRPDAPQLPLYAVTLDPPPIGLAFVEVRVDGIAYEGVAGRDLAVAGVRPLAEWAEFPVPRASARNVAQAAGTIGAWREALAQWRRVLERLGERFRAGEAAVDPKTRATCAWCPLPGLCRIDERGLLARSQETESGYIAAGDSDAE